LIVPGQIQLLIDAPIAPVPANCVSLFLPILKASRKNTASARLPAANCGDYHGRKNQALAGSAVRNTAPARLIPPLV